MTQKEKELVLKDLCGRLPFHVKVAIDFKGYLKVLPDDENLQYPYRKNLKFILDYDNKTIEDISKEPNILYAYPCTERFAMLRGYTYELDYGVPVEFIKPYLRPMSSMTDEEKTEYFNMHVTGVDSWYIVDWLNKRYLDYHYLVYKGLALEAPKGMYKSNIERSIRSESA